ncbi:MAG: flagellar biosynthetic protein FliO [Pseudomonadales bacterium]|nr:flagellar biosynthetic protein FliO [Pseudomonadales bacterium]
MDTGGAVLQIALALLVTLGLVMLLAFAAKKFTGIGGRNSSLIKIVSVTQLGTKEKLVLVQAGDKQILLGVTSQQISNLCGFDDALINISTQPAEPVDFSSALKRWMKRKA